MPRPTPPVWFLDQSGYVGNFRLSDADLGRLMDLLGAPEEKRARLAVMLNDIAQTYFGDLNTAPTPSRKQSATALREVIKWAKKLERRFSRNTQQQLRARLLGLDREAGFAYALRSAALWEEKGGIRADAVGDPTLLLDYPQLVADAAADAIGLIPSKPGPEPDADLHLTIQRLLGVYAWVTGTAPTVFFWRRAEYESAPCSPAGEFCKLFLELAHATRTPPEAIATVMRRQIWQSGHAKKGAISVPDEPRKSA